MNFQVAKQVISIFMCVILVPITAQAGADTYGTQAQPQTSSAPATTPAPLTADQLDSLVAPIALYPDALVAQVLAAAAYPDQVAFADDWLSQNQQLQGSSLAAAVNQQSWDPSVKALTQFPTVLHDLAKNLAWTSNLGQAFSNQQADVMAAVQVMRARAQAAGTLKSTTQVKVVQQSPQTIVIEPADPAVVYVPEYNPTIVYGSPFVVPLYTPPVAVAAATVSFGAGVAIGAAFGGGGFVGGGGFSWGFGSWGCNWGGGGGGGNVIYNHNTYINKTIINRTTNYNNYHPWNRNGQTTAGTHPYPNGYNGRMSASTPNGGENGNHGLIGGRGGVEQGQRAGDQRPENNLRAANYQRDNPREGWQRNAGGADRPRSDGFQANGQRSAMSGNGNWARAEANRGRASMNRGGGGFRGQPRGEEARGRR